MRTSVIISTYQQPQWLDLALEGWRCQTHQPSEIIIADDGSDQRTVDVIFLDVIASHRSWCKNLVHVWHEDSGFQKTTILNKAIVASTGSYIVFTDGDCIPRNDFFAAHIAHAQPGRFLSGGYHKLPLSTSQLITVSDIQAQNCFRVDWLKHNGMQSSRRNLKLTAKGVWASLLDHLTSTRPSFNGHNSSAWCSDLMATNGFDMRMKYGGEDRELGERLENRGVKGNGIRYRAICVHLDHARGYINEEDLELNNEIRHNTRQQKILRTEFGIEHLSNT